MAPREVRQPEVAGRLATLALALVLAAPVARDAVSLVLSAAFLAEFLTDGALPALDALDRLVEHLAGEIDAGEAARRRIER